MGRPDNLDQFGLIQCDDIEVYVAPDIWQRIRPQAEKILIAIEGYGRFWLWLTNNPS
jgi:hypothetical protein